MKIRTLTESERAEMVILRAIHEEHEKWRAGRTSYKIQECPETLRMTNEQRSRLEVLSFLDYPPERYFAYVKEQGSAGIIQSVTTWIGDGLADVTWQGVPFKVWGTFGQPSIRVNFRALAISGHAYSGTYYKSSGDYCRMRRIKQ